MQDLINSIIAPYLKNIFDPAKFFYLYLYPIVSSIFAGYIFWFIFSKLPDGRRKKSFDVGITNDLLMLNNSLFLFIDMFIVAGQNSIGYFQDKITGSNLTREDLNMALQNKIITNSYLSLSPFPDRMFVVLERFSNAVNEIDKIVNRLYSFNYFLSSKEVALLRNMHEKVNRYVPYLFSIDKLNPQPPYPTNPPLAFMGDMLFSLQEDFRIFRKHLFEKKIVELSFIQLKTQYFFHSGYYSECIKECGLGIKNFPFDANAVSFLSLLKVNSFFCLGKKRQGYELLSKVLNEKTEIMGLRYLLYPLLSDVTSHQIVVGGTSHGRVVEMKKLVEEENRLKQNFISSNLELKKRFGG